MTDNNGEGIKKVCRINKEKDEVGKILLTMFTLF